MIEISKEISNLAIEYLPALIDEKKMRCWLLNVFYSLQTRCPKCGVFLEGKAQKSFLRFERTRCRSCENFIKFSQGTPLHNQKIPYESFVFLSALAQLATNHQQAHQLLGVKKGMLKVVLEGDD